MKKNLVLYFDAPGKVSFAYEYIKKSIRIRQEELLACFPQQKVDIFIARGKESYVEENTFIPHFQKNGKKWNVISGKTIKADIVLGFPIPVGVTHIFPSIRDITLDKTLIEHMFPQFTLSSILCNSYEDIVKYFGKIDSFLKVLKPLCGTRGRGIYIGENIPEKHKISQNHYPYILQEFFDTSSGWGRYMGYHDFRVVILNGQVIGKFLRQPKEGSYISNTHKKGSFFDLTLTPLTQDIQDIIQHIDHFLSKSYPVRFYSIDFGRGTLGELKIFEMNSAPGLSTPKVAHALGNYIKENILKIE